MYSEHVRRLVAELPNSGPLEDRTHFARVENPVCGDILELSLRIEDRKVMACRFRASGCPAAIAASAAVTILTEGLTIEVCRAIDVQELLDYLGGLPSHKIHGAELALEALQKSLSN